MIEFQKTKTYKNLKFRRTKVELNDLLTVAQAKEQRVISIMDNLYNGRSDLAFFVFALKPSERQRLLAIREESRLKDYDNNGKNYDLYKVEQNKMFDSLIANKYFQLKKQIDD
jgi:hypothetical protein